ncbi:hypothetical protein [Entomobacter blattae]|uniref:Uncharacterized protein n=1 Tax=Entomobacter blattae TaxID=2762277 RepID=A0A7H1NR81_9PROT|nr:hypothetical protein [Entomobacter blattae]QNT78291.1 hypothetical protein JGUZn3_10630 [Entomobacter blattae]
MADLLLNRTTWDLVADPYGNIAVTHEPYAIAQSVANEVKLFAGEGWYDTRQGIPHFTTSLGVVPHRGMIRQKIEEAARTVPGVVGAVARLGLNKATRVMEGSIVVSTQTGEELNVPLS